MAKKDSTGCGGITVILVLAFVGAKLLGLSPIAFVGGLITSEPFGCVREQANIAHAASANCPASLAEARQDAGWAADRIAEISDKKPTVGLFYDGETEQPYTSGESDNAYETAVTVLDEIHARSDPLGQYPAASHVEVKIAAMMRTSETIVGVLVINNPRICSFRSGMSCTELLSRILPDESTLYVWTPGTSQPTRSKFEGVSS